MRPLTHLEPGQLCLRGTSVLHSSLSGSSLGALLGTEADTHDAADDAADNGAAGKDNADDDKDDDASGHASCISAGEFKSIALTVVANVAIAFDGLCAGFAIAPAKIGIVVAHF